jgi:hypothetical protein
VESILKNLYYGKFNPDKFIDSKEPEYLKLCNKALEVMKLLRKNVSDEDYKIITDLLDLHNEMNAFEVVGAFKHGFKSGSLIMMEIFTDKEFD